MKKEVLSAVNFLVDLLRTSNSTGLSEEQLLKFRKHAYECLWQHYQNHWFPESPQKGSGYRCIRINGKMDPLIARAGELVGLAASSLRALFPSELTMWVDPSEVAYRIGENGSICSLYIQIANISTANGKSPAEVKKLQEEQQQQQQQVSPAKAAPPKHQPPSSPQLTVEQLKQQQQHHIQQFTPSKLQQHHHQQQQQQHQQFHSPPRSPVFNSRPQQSLTLQQQQQQQHHQQQQQQLAMFLLNSHHHHHQNHSVPASNCKDSLLRNFDTQSRNLERLFVSS